MNKKTTLNKTSCANIKAVKATVTDKLNYMKAAATGAAIGTLPFLNNVAFAAVDVTEWATKIVQLFGGIAVVYGLMHAVGAAVAYSKASGSDDANEINKAKNKATGAIVGIAVGGALIVGASSVTCGIAVLFQL